jgi:hypothetical protein
VRAAPALCSRAASPTRLGVWQLRGRSAVSDTPEVMCVRSGPDLSTARALSYWRAAPAMSPCISYSVASCDRASGAPTAHARLLALTVECTSGTRARVAISLACTAPRPVSLTDAQGEKRADLGDAVEAVVDELGGERLVRLGGRGRPRLRKRGERGWRAAARRQTRTCPWALYSLASDRSSWQTTPEESSVSSCSWRQDVRHHAGAGDSHARRPARCGCLGAAGRQTISSACACACVRGFSAHARTSAARRAHVHTLRRGRRGGAGVIALSGTATRARVQYEADRLPAQPTRWRTQAVGRQRCASACRLRAERGWAIHGQGARAQRAPAEVTDAVVRANCTTPSRCERPLGSDAKPSASVGVTSSETTKVPSAKHRRTSTDAACTAYECSAQGGVTSSSISATRSCSRTHPREAAHGGVQLHLDHVQPRGVGPLREPGVTRGDGVLHLRHALARSHGATHAFCDAGPSALVTSPLAESSSASSSHEGVWLRSSSRASRTRRMARAICSRREADH